MDFTCGTAGPSRMPMQAFARLLKADVCPQAATLPSDIRWCHMQWHLYETICFFVIFNYIRCRPRSAANIPVQMKCILARHETSCTYSYRTDLIISIIKLKSFWTGLFMLSSVLILPLIIQVDWIRIHWPNSELIKKKKYLFLYDSKNFLNWFQTQHSEGEQVWKIICLVIWHLHSNCCRPVLAFEAFFFQIPYLKKVVSKQT